MGIINDVYSKWEKENESWTCLEEDPRSLKSCLRNLGFVHLLKDLDDNLEAVRKHKIREDAHKEMIKDFDKKLLKLSLKVHPDHSSGSTEKTKAHDNQAIINAVRTLLNRLSKDFLKDIDIDYRYEYYAYIDISGIGNEEDVDKFNLNLQYQLIMLSEIKHEKIIANIKKFLVLCEGSLDCYYNDDRRNFNLNFNLAANRLKDCILGYQELTKEFRIVEKECEKDHHLRNTLWIVKRVSADFERQLKSLEKIYDVAKQCLKGNFQFYTEKNETIDNYFVLPFVKYINVLSMCNVMLGNSVRNWLDLTNNRIDLDFSQQDGSDEERKYLKAYCLAAYFHNPISSNKRALTNFFTGDSLKSSCKIYFDSILKNIRDELKKDFDAERHYVVRSVKKRTEEYNRNVQDFFEVMLRRKKSNMLALIDSQEISRIDGRGKAMLLNQRIRYENNIAKIYQRNKVSDEDFMKEVIGEEELLEKMKDNFKERGEKLKASILQSELTKENLKEELDAFIKEERLMIEKLSKFGSQKNEKLIDEILKQEEENGKLREEIEIKREEERHLNLTLCGKYEKISSLLQEKINENENKIPRKEINKEKSSLKNFNEAIGCEQAKNYRALHMLKTEENISKSLKNGYQKTSTARLSYHLNNQSAVPTSGKSNTLSKSVEIGIQNKNPVKDSLKEKNNVDVSSDEIDEPLSLHEIKTEDQVSQTPEIVEIVPRSSEVEILNNATENKKDVDECESAEEVHELQIESDDSKIPIKEVQSQKCTDNFGENDTLKEDSRDIFTERKSCTHFDSENDAAKNYAHCIEKTLKKKNDAKDEASDIDTEKIRLYEIEQEKNRVQLEALRNVKQTCELNINVIKKQEHYNIEK